MNLFGQAPKKIDVTEQAKQWKRNIIQEQRKLDRDIGRIKKEEQKAVLECKKIAKAGQINAARIIAREIANTRKTIDRMMNMKTQMHSVEMQLQSSISMMKIQGCLSKTTEIMHSMNGLMRLPELNKSMGEMAREMEKSGLIEEVMNDTMGILDNEGIEEAADLEVDKIISDALAGILTSVSATPREIKATPTSSTDAKEEEEVDDMDAMRSRISALK